jgi:hypothetical protein
MPITNIIAVDHTRRGVHEWAVGPARRTAAGAIDAVLGAALLSRRIPRASHRPALVLPTSLCPRPGP